MLLLFLLLRDNRTAMYALLLTLIIAPIVALAILGLPIAEPQHANDR